MMKPFTQLAEKATATISGLMIAALPYVVAAQTSGNTLKNPTSFPDIQSFIAAFLKAIVEISLPIITLFFVYSGFLFIKARGNPGQLDEAKNNFLYVFLGAGLILGAWILATLIGATVTQVIGTS
jgi:hypothetical protein